MTQTYTPGPWAATKQEIFSCVDDARVATAWAGHDSQGMLNKAIGAAQADANARLIAAAPDLLTVAVNVEAAITESGTEANLDNILAALRAAIAKATGTA